MSLLQQSSALVHHTESRFGQMVRLTLSLNVDKTLTAESGWLMFSIVTLTLFNLLVLLHPPEPVRLILGLMILPFPARMSLLFAAMFNVALSMAFEEWGTQVVAQLIGTIQRLRRGRRRTREGKAYKAVEGGMR